MKLIKLPMGCLSSRSSVTPSDTAVESNGRAKNRGQPAQMANGNSLSGARNDRDNNNNDHYSSGQMRNMIDSGGGHSSYMGNNINSTRGASLKKKSISRENSLGSSVRSADDDIISLLIEQKGAAAGHKSKHRKGGSDDGLSPRQQRPGGKVNGREHHLDTDNNSLNDDDDDDDDDDDGSAGADEDYEGNTSMPSKRNEGSFDEGLNMDMLREYVAIDYEITQLEDKDALRVYHEKIEQLEQLERELDMIGSEVEEVAGRSMDEANMSQAASVTGDGRIDSRMDLESNSMLSGVSGNTSHRSWLFNGDHQNQNPSNQSINNKSTGNKTSSKTASPAAAATNKGAHNKGSSATGSQMTEGQSYAGSQRTGGTRNGANQITYSTIEEVFNRKIILEKERDKLKKEVEIVILECDKLQQRYKKRDEILDKLFDGRTGNGLENHLEQQLNWLLEQKHYVDQVFFAWKRAETLTSQTCEQFASALELLKKLPKIEQSEERTELAKSIERLLLKSRQDMDQAQKYNPNVDAPFFTDNETERFDKIIKTIQSEQINPSDYSQILTVIQFAYKRAVSIRLWLEQILQTTIARDSFELAEEYKWIAIQLRKERINLIKSKLLDSPYRSMVRSIHEQVAQQQSISDRKQTQNQEQHEVNRDSGIESEPNDLDIEEEIYRVLEMNKSRIESTTTGTVTGGLTDQSTTTMMMNNSALMNRQAQQLRVAQQSAGGALSSASGSESNQRDLVMQERVQRRVGGAHQLHLDQVEPHMLPSTASSDGHLAKMQSGSSSRSSINTANHDSRLRGASSTPTKLKVELDEDARQSLLKQVDRIHVRHKDRIERLRVNNRANATEYITNKMQTARQSASALAEQQLQ